MRKLPIYCILLLLILFVLLSWARRPSDGNGSVTFLQETEGRDIFDLPMVKSLIKSYRYNECVVRSAGAISDRDSYRESMIRCYKQAVLEFTEQEKSVLLKIIQHDPRLSNKTWTFLKLASRIDWGFPFTLENIVVLPDSILQSITVKTLIHEHIHIEQRRNKSMFDGIYTHNFGYSRPAKLQIPSSILENSVTNPDGPDINWIKRIGDDWYWSALMLQDGKSKPKGMAYKCVISGPGLALAKVTETSVPLSDLCFAFDGHSNTYHPNEFIASLWSL